MNTVGWGLGGALLLFGCSAGDPVDIGNDDITGEELEDYGGSWDGYAEAFEFADGSDRVRLSLDDQGVGTITFGESTAFELTDPDVWPIPAEVRDYLYTTAVVLNGFAYTALETRVETKRIRFEFNAYQAESEWCELQTPIANTQSDGYGCGHHDWSFQELGDSCVQSHPVTGVGEPIDCGKLRACNVCRCDADGCTGSDFWSTPPGTFDAALAENGAELVGTVLIDDRALTVRLTRMD